MNKPIWLKSTYLKGLVSQFLAKRCTKNYFVSSREDSNGAVIISIDGLGDAFLRLSIVDALAKKHGQSNLWIVTRAMTNPLYERLGIQTIIYSDRHRTNPLKRIKLINQINRLNINKIYVLDFEHNERLLELLNARKKIGFQHPYRPDFQKELTTAIPHPFYVGVALENFCRETDITPKLMDNRSFFQNHDRKTHPSKIKSLAIAIGASNRMKMMRISNMHQLLLALEHAFPESQLLLLGAGAREENYVRRLLGHYPGKATINLVSKLPLPALIDVVNECDGLIGFDSAVYNLAFTLHKPTICLAYTNGRVLHSEPWVRVIRASGAPWGEPDEFGNQETNAIKPSEVIESLSSLLAVNSHQSAKPYTDAISY